MRLKKAALLSIWVWLNAPGMTLAQSVDSGNEVTVNPIAGSGGVLLNPGNQYMRVIHPVLQPGETLRDLGAIRLHMPTKHRVAARKAPATPREAAAVAPKPQQSKAVAAAAPRTQPAPNSGFGDLGAQGAVGLSLGLAPQPAQPAPTRMAKANPPPANVTTPLGAGAETPGLSKRSVILFAPQASDPAESAWGAIKFLAGDLNAAITSASSRIQIQAYGGNRGDKGFNVCNKSALATRVALGRFDGTNWTSQGWWTVAPKTCARLLTGPLQARYYYLYATDGAWGSWEGKTHFCTAPGTKFLVPGRKDCTGRGFDRRGFFEVDTGKLADWTQTLSN